jgi:HSP20 family protein
MPILVRKQDPSFQSLDPFRLMRDAFRWDPFLADVATQREASFIPNFDVKETKEGFILKADLPGVKDADINIQLTQNRLSVSGKREAEHKTEGENYHAIERSFGTFTRTFTLPDHIDAEKVQAEMKDGVLTLQLPKRAESATRQIAVKSAK